MNFQGFLFESGLIFAPIFGIYTILILVWVVFFEQATALLKMIAYNWGIFFAYVFLFFWIQENMTSLVVMIFSGFHMVGILFYLSLKTIKYSPTLEALNDPILDERPPTK